MTWSFSRPRFSNLLWDHQEGRWVFNIFCFWIFALICYFGGIVSEQYWLLTVKAFDAFEQHWFVALKNFWITLICLRCPRPCTAHRAHIAKLRQDQQVFWIATQFSQSHSLWGLERMKDSGLQWPKLVKIGHQRKAKFAQKVLIGSQMLGSQMLGACHIIWPKRSGLKIIHEAWNSAHIP